MLADFITANRDEIIARTRARAVSRPSPRGSTLGLTHGIPTFLEQLTRMLRSTGSELVDEHQLVASARIHGQDLLRMGLTIAQVVHDYGDVCQVVTDLAVEENAEIGAAEFGALNLCLDNAIAEAVTEYASMSERAISDRGTERLGTFAHELRNLLNTATLTFESIKSGRVAIGGSTSIVHGRSLASLRALVDRSLASVRLGSGIERLEPIDIDAAELVGQIEIGAMLHAQARDIELVIGPVDSGVTIRGDSQILTAALSNLIDNAFKFSPPQSRITLTTRVTADHVAFEVEDQCGGLPPGDTETLFRPFNHREAGPRGVGLGLSIARQAARAHSGDVRARNRPGIGCVFSLELPRTTTVVKR